MYSPRSNSVRSPVFFAVPSTPTGLFLTSTTEVIFRQCLWLLRGLVSPTHPLGLLEVSTRFASDRVLEGVALFVSHTGEESLVFGGQNEWFSAIAASDS